MADIAWDLAGAIVEWEMVRAAEEGLLEQFSARTGDRVAKRIEPYILAYAIFRMAYCTMAAYALRGSPEHAGMIGEANRYRTMIVRMAGEVQPPTGPPEMALAQIR